MMKRFLVSIAAWGVLGAVASVASAAPHKAFKPMEVDKAVPTHANSHTVGHIVFSKTYHPATHGPEVPEDYFIQLTIKQGEALPELWNRGYYPATVKEVIDRVEGEDKGKNFMLTTLAYLDGERVMRSRNPVESSMLVPEWNTNATAVIEGASDSVRDKIAKLAPGKHTLTIWRQIDYNAWLLNDKGWHDWFDKYVAIGKGTLEITVTP